MKFQFKICDNLHKVFGVCDRDIVLSKSSDIIMVVESPRKSRGRRAQRTDRPTGPYNYYSSDANRTFRQDLNFKI